VISPECLSEHHITTITEKAGNGDNRCESGIPAREVKLGSVRSEGRSCSGGGQVEDTSDWAMKMLS
jgi:hypothetical protein